MQDKSKLYSTYYNLDTFEGREDFMAAASKEHFPAESETGCLPLFEKMSLAWWYRDIWQADKPSKQEYRQELIRTYGFQGENVHPEILQKYPPATGVLKMIPGDTSFYPKGVTKKELLKRWSRIYVYRPLPQGLIELCRKSR